MQINKLISKYNHNKGNISRIKYIVIHFVGDTGGAQNNCRYFAGGDRGSSAHYFVGFDGEVWQSVEDANIAWHCGTSGTYKHASCRNSNSLGIELCVKKTNLKSKSDTDKDWYFTDATVNSAIELTKELMKKYNVPVSNVIRHYDVTGKICPNPFVYNHTKHTWTNFKNALIGATINTPVTESTSNNSIKENSFNATLTVTYQGEDGIEVHNTPDLKSDSCNKEHGPVGPKYNNGKNGSVFTVTHKVILTDGSVMYKIKSGLYITGNEKYVSVKSNVNTLSYQKGEYRTLTEMKVRSGAGTNYTQVEWEKMTLSAKSLNPKKSGSNLGYYKEGLVFTAQEVVNKEKEAWAKTPSGYICLELNGTKYCKAE